MKPCDTPTVRMAALFVVGLSCANSAVGFAQETADAKAAASETDAPSDTPPERTDAESEEKATPAASDTAVNEAGTADAPATESETQAPTAATATSASGEADAEVVTQMTGSTTAKPQPADASAQGGAATNTATPPDEPGGPVASQPSPHDATPPKKPTHRHLFHLSYDMAVPTGDSRDFVSSFSPRGMTFEYRFHVTPNIGLGALIGWNKFDIKETGTFEYDIVTITGTQVRAMDSMRISFAFNYNFLPANSVVVPYLGAEMGAYHVWRMCDFGWWNVTDTYWHFGFAPGLGVIVNMKSLTLLLGSKFHMAVRTQDAPSETYVTFSIGVGIPN